MDDIVRKYLQNCCAKEVKSRDIYQIVGGDKEDFRKFLHELSCFGSVTVQKRWKELGIVNYERKWDE